MAGFDVNPLIVGTSICGVPIYNVEELNTRRKEYNAEIGIVAVPVDKAQEVAEKMIAAGIKAIWNFTPVRIRATEDVVIQDTSIYSHLAVMYNRLDAQNTKVK